MASAAPNLRLLPPVPIDPVGDVRRLRAAGQRPPTLELIRSLHEAHTYTHTGRHALRGRRVAVSRDLVRPSYEIVRMLAVLGARPAPADARRVDAIIVSDDPDAAVVSRAAARELVLIGEHEFVQLVRAVSVVADHERAVLDQLLQRVRSEAPVLGRRQDAEVKSVSATAYARARVEANNHRRGEHLHSKPARRVA